MGYLATILLILLLISINAFFAVQWHDFYSSGEIDDENSQGLNIQLLERPNEF